MSGRYRGGAPGAPGPVRTLCRMRARGAAGRAGARPGGDPGVHRALAVDGELDQVVVGVAEVHAGRRAARARARSGAGLGLDAVFLQEREDLVDGSAPLETEVGAAHRRAPRAEIARTRGRVGPVDVDLLRVVDADRRHVRPPRSLLPRDREAEPLVEAQGALQIARDDHPVVDAFDSHRRPPIAEPARTPRRALDPPPPPAL